MEENCSYQTFLCAVPHYIRKPSASDCGILKKNIEKDIKLKEMVKSQTDFDEFIAFLKQINMK